MEIVRFSGAYEPPVLEYLSLMTEGSVLTMSGTGLDGYTDKGDVIW